MSYIKHKFFKLKTYANGYGEHAFTEWMLKNYRSLNSVEHEKYTHKHSFLYLVTKYPDDFEEAPFYHLNC